MKLNNECIRELLLYVEENVYISDDLDIADIDRLNYTKDELLYTAIKLKEAGYLNATIELDVENYTEVIIHSLTWLGHKFLDNIRDDGVWKKTMGIISKFSSVSIGIIENVAAQVITNLINQQLGQ